MADDIVIRLRELMADLLYNPDCDDEGCGDCAWHRIGADAIDEIERLQAIVATVDDLHSCRLAHDTCLACYRDWPCPTHLLIHPKEARRG